MINTKQKKYIFLSSLITLLFFSVFSVPERRLFAGDFIKTVTDFMADGTWTAPQGVTNISIEGWGGGGAGAGNTAASTDGEGGGGGGAYAKINSFTVTPGTGYATDLGAGAAGTTGQNVNGSDTTFNSTTMVADAGSGGSNDTGGNGGGAGGTTAGSTGDVEYAGGTGGNGGTGGATDIGSGGGGGAAGAGGVGGTGGNGSAGVAGSAGATGPGLLASLNFLWNIGGGGGLGLSSGRGGTAGDYPGGGGSGAFVDSGTDRSGGSGINGKIAVTYLEPTNSGYPQFVNKSNFATSTATSAIAPLPSGYLKGDLILFVIAGRASGTAGSNDTITVPTGWTQRGSRQRFEVGINDLVLELWYKIATSTSDSNDVSVGTAFSGSEGWVMQTFAYRGVNQGSPFSSTNVGGTNSSAVTFTPTGATPAPLNSSNRSRVVTFVVSADNNMLAFDSSRGFFTRTGSNESVGSPVGVTGIAPAVSLYVADQATTTTSAAIMPVFEQVINGSDGWAYISEALEPAPPSRNVIFYGGQILKLIGNVIKIGQQ